MKKVLIFALIVAFLSVVSFAVTTDSVELTLRISKAVALELGEASGIWDWTNPVGTGVDSLGTITVPATIYANCAFKLTGGFEDGDAYILGISGNGIKVNAALSGAHVEGVGAVATGVGPISYSDLVTYGGLGTGKAVRNIVFSLENDGNYNWYDTAAGDYTITYTATIEAQ